MKNLGIVIFLCGLTGLAVFGAMRMGLLPNTPAVADNSGEKPLKTEADFRGKLAEIKMDKDKAMRAIKKLEARKQENVDYLKEKGIRKVADAKGNPDAEMALNNLKGWTESIASLQAQLSHYDNAISRIDGMLKKIERDLINESAGLTEEQEIELRSIVRDLDDRLGIGENDIFRDAELDALLEKEFGEDQPPKNDGE